MASPSRNRLSGMVKKSATKGKQKPVPVKIVSDQISTSDYDKKWRAQDDLRALQRAEEIRRDKSRMSAAKAEAKAEMKRLSSVCK